MLSRVDLSYTEIDDFAISEPAPSLIDLLHTWASACEGAIAATLYRMSVSLSICSCVLLPPLLLVAPGPISSDCGPTKTPVACRLRLCRTLGEQRRTACCATAGSV